MQISNRGIALIKQFESCRLEAYVDPAGVMSIGYSWTRGVNGRTIKRGMKINQATADRLLRCEMVQYERTVNQLVAVALTQNQFDALISLAYNIGTRVLSTSTLLRKLNAKDYVGAADEFLHWNQVSGKELVGLISRRRMAERMLFSS